MHRAQSDRWQWVTSEPWGFWMEIPACQPSGALHLEAAQSCEEQKTRGPLNQSIYYAKHTTYEGGKIQLHRFLTSALRPRDRSVALSSPNRPGIQWTGGWASLTASLGDLRKETSTTPPICCTKFLFVNYCTNWRTKSLCKKLVLKY